MTQTSERPEPSPATQAPGPPAVSRPAGVIVLKRGKKKGKKKRKYSRGLKKAQIAGRRSLKGLNRLARAVSKGFALFRKRSNKSSRKKRDGMLRDLTLNVGRGAGRTLRVSSVVPLNLAKAVQGPGLRKPNRRVTKGLGRFLRSFGLLR
jgi:hypothetical protein